MYKKNYIAIIVKNNYEYLIRSICNKPRYNLVVVSVWIVLFVLADYPGSSRQYTQ